MPSGKSKNGCLCCNPAKTARWLAKKAAREAMETEAMEEAMEAMDDATNLWTMIKEEEASLDDFDVEEPVPEEAEDGQLDEDARICSLKFSATTDLA